MTSVLILYASSLGNTRRMADAIAEGAQDVEGATAR
jgi:flavodoxin